MKVSVKPLYGWGWFRSDGSAFDVPPPFEFEATPLDTGIPLKGAIGQVKAENHPLSGLWLLLSQRHMSPDGEFNVAAYRKMPERSLSEPSEISGFAHAAISN